MISFDTLDNFKTGNVLYFAKLQSTKMIAFCMALSVNNISL